MSDRHSASQLDDGDLDVLVDLLRSFFTVHDPVLQGARPNTRGENSNLKPSRIADPDCARE